MTTSAVRRRFVRPFLNFLEPPVSQPGFSLVEVVTSLFIIVLITAVFLSNYKYAEKRTDLTMAAQNVVSDIHLAQSYAMGLAEYAGDVPVGGWGVHFDTASSTADRYFIFADVNGNQRYDSGEESANAGGRTSYFSSNVRLKQFSGVTNPLDIIFVPPDPLTIISGGSGTSTSADIVITENQNNTVKTVEVNFLGLVEVTD